LGCPFSLRGWQFAQRLSPYLQAQKCTGWDRKIRVGLDWFFDLIFPRELSYLNLARTQVVNQAHFEAGDFIIRQGDVGDQFYVIISGQVEVIRELPDGQKVSLARLGKGEYFGESSLLTGRRRNASVQAISQVDLMCLGRDEFNNLVGTWLQFSDNLQALSEERARALSSSVEQSYDFATVVASPVQRFHRTGSETPPANAISVGGAPPYLVRSDGAQLPLEGDVLHIGRAPDNHIVINDKQMSRRHAVIKREGPNYVLEDVGTSNGTYVNQQRIQRHMLAQGDIIRLGQTVFTYRTPVADQRLPSS
jgi:CRP-like cAMP-binding protein